MECPSGGGCGETQCTRPAAARTIQVSIFRRGFFLLAIALTNISCSNSRDEGTIAVLEKLVEESKRHMTAVESTALSGLHLSAGDALELAAYVRAHPDDTAYHVLIGLRRAGGTAY